MLANLHRPQAGGVAGQAGVVAGKEMAHNLGMVKRFWLYGLSVEV
ncbi:MAG: hypothetical protein ACKOYK_01675 [Cyanobium sp.]